MDEAFAGFEQSVRNALLDMDRLIEDTIKEKMFPGFDDQVRVLQDLRSHRLEDLKQRVDLSRQITMDKTKVKGLLGSGN